MREVSPDFPLIHEEGKEKQGTAESELYIKHLQMDQREKRGNGEKQGEQFYPLLLISVEVFKVSIETWT